MEKLKAEEVKLAELERVATEEEEVELARQANELAEIARQQTEELQNGEFLETKVVDNEILVDADIAVNSEQTGSFEPPAVEEITPSEEDKEENVVVVEEPLSEDLNQ